MLVVAILVASIGVALAVLALLPPRPGVTKENYDRIAIGMTYDEVEAILGPPGERTEGWVCWESEDPYIFIMVRFDEEDRVRRKGWEGDDDRSVWTKLLDHLPWRKKEPEVLTEIGR